MTVADPPFSEPTGNWGAKPASRIESGEYTRDHDGHRVKVIASYAGVGGQSASATVWYVDAHRHGRPTQRIACDPEDYLPIELPA